MTPLWLQLASAVCLVIGAAFSVAAGVGLLRFVDPLARMHAATKPQIAGLLFVLIGIALANPRVTTVAFVIPILLFQMLTAPVAAHVTARAGYRTDNVRHDLLTADELAPAIERADENGLLPAPPRPPVPPE